MPLKLHHILYMVVAALIVSAPIFIVLASLITAIREHKFAYRSEEGLRAARYYEGLELYMRMAEAERLNFLQSVDGADTSPSGIVKLYEQLLPYAIIFGLETSWMAELSRYYEMDGVECGTWYAGVAIMNSHDFHSFVSTTSSEIRASTTSSSNSGSGGGGFSGGGGGGGGGGGR